MIPTKRLVASLVFVGILVVTSLAAWFLGVRPTLGLDLRGGIRVVLTAPDGTTPEVMQRAGESIRQRVDAIGVAEPDLVVSGTNIEVQIPGTAQGKIVEKDGTFCVFGADGKGLGCLKTREEAEAALQSTSQERLLNLIGTTDRLEQREVLSTITKVLPGAAPVVPGQPAPSAQPNPEWDANPVTCGTEAERAQANCSFDVLKAKEVVFLSKDGQTKYKLGPQKLSGDAISSATALNDTTGQNGGGWYLSFKLTPDGTKIFSQVTKDLINKQLAIVVDQEVLSAPTVQGQIVGSGQITGSFTETEAKDLATALNAGSLPVNLARSEVVTVSATLGSESLRQGLFAGAAGLMALMLYLAFYYRLLGFVTWAGMTIWAILAIGIISLLSRTAGYSLTLAGVAGLIVSLGITADSYIVFYERLKDEVRNGKNPRTAVVPGFRRAWRTIVAADVVTLLAAVILYLVAISSVRGFALTLGISVMLDLFVVYFFKRPVVFLMARKKHLISRKSLGFHEEVVEAASSSSTAGRSR